jgi:hypothetical protein
MVESHYTAMAGAYVVALGGWLATQRALPGVWPLGAEATFARPRREVAIALLGVVGVLAVGQLWSRGIRLPETGALGPLLGAVNQLFIFAPIVLVPIVRRQPWSTAWLGRRKLAARVVAGVVLSTLAVVAYTLLRSGVDPPWELVGRIWAYDNLDVVVQVFLEDVTIAILFVRLAAAIGRGRAIVLVACLFAAGHIPAMISKGASLHEISLLLRDAGLGTAVIYVVQRSRDIVWFWCVHFCMDMTQFDHVTLGRDLP